VSVLMWGELGSYGGTVCLSSCGVSVGPLGVQCVCPPVSVGPMGVQCVCLSCERGSSGGLAQYTRVSGLIVF
jgi:hypothetical protein